MRKASKRSLVESLRNLLMVFSEVSTDRGVLAYDTEELVEGSIVEIVSEDGEKSTPEDGDYTLEDGTVLGIVSGRIEKIVKPEEPEAIEEEPKAEEPESLEEETPKEEPQTEEEQPNEEVSEEPASEEAPKDESDALKELKDSIDALKAEVESLRERLTKLENSPAAEPIAEEFTKQIKTTKTGNKNLDYMLEVAASRR